MTTRCIRTADLAAEIHAAAAALGTDVPLWMVDNWLRQASAEHRFGLHLNWASFRCDPDEVAGVFAAEVAAIRAGEVVLRCADCGAPIVPSWYACEHSGMFAHPCCGACDAARLVVWNAAHPPVRYERSESWGT